MVNAGVKNFATKKSGNDELKTHVAPIMERPVRVRKSKERLIEVMEHETAKKLNIEQGRGTPLKDIPNVVYKLSKKKKADETLKQLHTVLYNRRGKALKIRSNILCFSGFLWTENEEKEKNKLQKKLNKFSKEKLIEFCFLLDVPISRAAAKKDVIATLIDFLLVPHATTSVLFEEKEQSRKGNKRKRVRVNIAGASTFEATPSKKGKSASEATPETEEEKEEDKEVEEEEKAAEEGEDETEAEEEEEEEYESEEEEFESEFTVEASNVVKEKTPEEDVEEEAKDETEAEDGEEEESEEEEFESVEASNVVVKEKTPEEEVEEEAKGETEAEDETETEDGAEEESEEEVVEPESTVETSNDVKVSLKEKTQEEENLKPSDDELRTAICEILLKVDVSVTSTNDIMKLLNERFNTDLTPRKKTCKSIAHEEINRMSDTKEDSS